VLCAAVVLFFVRVEHDDGFDCTKLLLLLGLRVAGCAAAGARRLCAGLCELAKLGDVWLGCLLC
jgi:hypothetical protein